MYVQYLFCRCGRTVSDSRGIRSPTTSSADITGMTQRAGNLPYKCALKSDNILNILKLLGNTVIKKFSASSVCLHSLCQWSNSKTAFCPMLQSKNIVFLFVVHLSQPFRLFYNRSAKQASPRYAHCVEMLGVQG